MVLMLVLGGKAQRAETVATRDVALTRRQRVFEVLRKQVLAEEAAGGAPLADPVLQEVLEATHEQTLVIAESIREALDEARAQAARQSEPSVVTRAYGATRH